MKGRFRKIVLGLVCSIVSAILCLAALEGIARFALPPPPATLFTRRDVWMQTRPFVQRHPTRGFSLRPSYRDAWYGINRAGFRGEELPDDLAGRFLIIVFGESTTFGWDVKNGEDYPSQLRDRFRPESDKVYVINAGVPSYTSTQVLLLLKETARRFRPDVVLASVMWNDIWYSSVAEWSPDLLLGRVPPDWLCVLLRHSIFLRRVLLKEPPPSSRVNQPNEEALEQYTRNIEAMIAWCRSHNIPLAFVQPPFDRDRFPAQGVTPFHTHYSKPFFIELSGRYRAALGRTAAAHGVPVIDHRLSPDHGGDAVRFLDCLHPSPEGHRMIAEDIHRYLKEHFPDVPR